MNEIWRFLEETKSKEMTNKIVGSEIEECATRPLWDSGAEPGGVR